MTERQQAILVAIIEQYAEIAAPVGSVTLAKLFGVSSATIRSEMAKLEEMGFIEAPHTSAGRIPTDKGYRFYVNGITASFGSSLYMNGMTQLFSQPEFGDGDHVQAVAKLIDNIEPWLREAAPDEPLNVFIGSENPIGKSSGATLIISKFKSSSGGDNYIGVIGPTRQNYRRTMELVRRTGAMLEEVL